MMDSLNSVHLLCPRTCKNKLGLSDSGILQLQVELRLLDQDGEIALASLGGSKSCKCTYTYKR